MRVIFAVPNYNMRENLGQLLTSLSAEENDGIFLLDDASTDGSADYVEAIFPDIIVVRGERNAGAGANRNRLLPFLSGQELILFVDADQELKSAGLARTVRGWFADATLGLAGSLILDKSGAPYIWNYGFAMDPRRESRVGLYQFLERAASEGSPLRELIRRVALGLHDTYEFEIKNTEPVSRRVDWVSEGLFAVRADLFRRLGGFDERFRYHTGQDLCLRIVQAGAQVRFEPGITVHHLEIDVRGRQRFADFREGQWLYYQKHWGMSREVFERLHSAP